MLSPSWSASHILPLLSNARVSRCAKFERAIPNAGSMLLVPAASPLIWALEYLKTSPLPPLPLDRSSSTTHRLPAASKARCEGELKLKLFAFRMTLGVGLPLAAYCEGVYSRISCPSSAPTHMFPDASKTIPSGPSRLLPPSSEIVTSAIGSGRCFFFLVTCGCAHSTIVLVLKFRSEDNSFGAVQTTAAIFGDRHERNWIWPMLFFPGDLRLRELDDRIGVEIRHPQVAAVKRNGGGSVEVVAVVEQDLGLLRAAFEYALKIRDGRRIFVRDPETAGRCVASRDQQATQHGREAANQKHTESIAGIESMVRQSVLLRKLKAPLPGVLCQVNCNGWHYVYER